LNEAEEAKALQRQRVILAVLADRMTATQAALELGVSRKTFYEWRDRGLAAMLEALQDRPGGRPPLPVDPEKTQLQEALETVEQERLVLESRLRIQEAMRQTFNELLQGKPPPKKKRALRTDHASRGAGQTGTAGAVRHGVPGTRRALFQPDAVEKQAPGRRGVGG
jgi:transposase